MANPNTGLFTWHEIMSTDMAAAKSFYSELFGWRTQEMDMGPAGKYTIFMNGEIGVGGGMASPPGQPSYWLTYVGTEDTEAAVATIREHGGKILVPPTMVPNMVHFAIAMDPQGAAFGVVKDIGPRANEPMYSGTPRPGTFTWDELHTTDQDAAAKFYGKVFGWTGVAGDDPMKYWHWKNAGKDIGGMMKLMMPNVPPNWLSYIAVTDVEGSTKRAKELGGKVHMDTMDIAKVGKFSVVADPSGGSFALFRSARV